MARWCRSNDILEYRCKNVGASTASIFLNIMPIVGIVTASITLNEIITMEECLGAVVILLGVYITTHTKQILEKLNWKSKINLK